MVKYKKNYVACAKTVDIHDILKIVSQFLSSVFDWFWTGYNVIL